ncbi:MAG: PHP-associated domain-containing protein, partial [Dehalococcoidia bacterium]|nr:PHP-associated domain-containing protein [Dehalococcoidia bacterium]
MSPFRVDLHVHTRQGSLDSTIEPAQMVEHARVRGLAGVAITEHFRLWSTDEAARWSTLEFRVYPAAEVVTEIGHVLAVGLDRFPRTRCIDELAEQARIDGAALVLAHPFRAYFDTSHHWLLRDGPVADPVAAAARQSTGLVSAIEVLNNGCTAGENRLASELAAAINVVPVASSDAHTIDHVGRYATSFARLPSDSRDLAAALMAGEAGVGIDHKEP